MQGFPQILVSLAERKYSLEPKKFGTFKNGTPIYHNGEYDSQTTHAAGGKKVRCCCVFCLWRVRQAFEVKFV